MNGVLYFDECSKGYGIYNHEWCDILQLLDFKYDPTGIDFVSFSGTFMHEMILRFWLIMHFSWGRKELQPVLFKCFILCKYREIYCFLPFRITTL